MNQGDYKSYMSEITVEASIRSRTSKRGCHVTSRIQLAEDWRSQSTDAWYLHSNHCRGTRFLQLVMRMSHRVRWNKHGSTFAWLDVIMDANDESNEPFWSPRHRDRLPLAGFVVSHGMQNKLNLFSRCEQRMWRLPCEIPPAKFASPDSLQNVDLEKGRLVCLDLAKWPQCVISETVSKVHRLHMLSWSILRSVSVTKDARELAEAWGRPWKDETWEVG